MNGKTAIELKRDFDKKDRSKNVDLKTNSPIKEIRKKFENLSSSDGIASSSESSKTPIAPLRKYKNGGSKANSKKSEQTYLTEISDKKYSARKSQLNTGITPNKSISVKERTKLFEGSGENPIVALISKNAIASTSEVTRNIPDKHKVKPSISNNPVDSIFETPPVKPPRSFINLEEPKNHDSIDGPVLNSESVKTNSVENCGIKTTNKFTSGEIKKRNSSSFSTESGTKKEINRCSRLLSAPEIPPWNINKDAVSKPQKDACKSEGIRNYFKNLSNTATNLRGKVKQTKIFVDLTPTTVSPPKHYGTLKRSHSEEHIYAEPFANGKLSPKSTEQPAKNDESLHYMCTPLVRPKVPDRKIPQRAVSRQSMRNMIYDSFSSLRLVPTENPDSKVSNAAGTEPDVSMKAIQDRIIYVKSIRQVSGSSICLAPKLYEAFYIMNLPENQPEVLYSFPLKVAEKFKFPLLPHICFPDAKHFKVSSVYQSETFQFTLFDKGERIFGYCLRIMGWPENSLDQHRLCVTLPFAICILSQFNAPLFYKKLLTEVEKHLVLSRAKCFKYIRSLQKLGIPNTGASVSIPEFTESLVEDRVVISRPLDSHTVGLELTRALQLLDVGILVKTVASLLLERRVLFLSSSPSNLYQCCKAISSLLYPFEWPHMFIPVLPLCLIVHCCSDLPYVLGISSNDSSSLLELLAEHNLLIIDIDKGTIVKSCNDEDTILPRKIQKALITALNLAKNMTDPTEMLRDIMISEAFVHMFVEMVGHYENHLVEQNGSLSFQREGFLKNAISYNVQIFLQWFTETQIFDTFINESTWRANYRAICQSNIRTLFEKRVDEYKWELSHDGEKISRFIEKTVRNLGERIIHKLKK